MKRAPVIETLAMFAVISVAAVAQQPAWKTTDGPVQVLVPLSGTWSADYENARQILTIDGKAAQKPPDAEAIKTVFPENAAAFAAALAAPGAFPLAVVRDVKQFANGRIQLQFKLIDGQTDQSAGIVFGLQSDGSYKFARYNTKDGNVAIWKFESGTRTVLQHGDLHEQLPLKVWHTLTLTVTGPIVVATANDTLSVRHAFDAPVTGRIGVWTKADSVTAFRHVTAGGKHGTHGGGGR